MLLLSWSRIATKVVRRPVRFRSYYGLTHIKSLHTQYRLLNRLQENKSGNKNEDNNEDAKLNKEIPTDEEVEAIRKQVEKYIEQTKNNTIPANWKEQKRKIDERKKRRKMVLQKPSQTEQKSRATLKVTIAEIFHRHHHLLPQNHL